MESSNTQSPLLHQLSLPKFLMKEANRALSRPGPYSNGLASSLLQDAAEAFLLILATQSRLNVNPNYSFSKVLDTVSRQIPIVSQYKAGLIHLNKARVMFKHYGLSTLQKNDVIVFAGNVENFITDLCKNKFKIEFASVSLADAVGHRRTQNWIKKAENSYEAGNFDAAVPNASGAMAIYLSHCSLDVSPTPTDKFFFGSLSLDCGQSVFGIGHPFKEGFSEFVASLQEHIDDIYNQLNLIAGGVDVSAYEKFNAITPTCCIMFSGGVRFIVSDARGPTTAEDARFCIDTVIDSVLALQNNRPNSRAAPEVPSMEMTVIHDTDMVVSPEETPPEIVRRVPKGEVLKAVLPNGHRQNGNFVRVLQDGEIAYVSNLHVRAVSHDSIEEQNDTEAT